MVQSSDYLEIVNSEEIVALHGLSPCRRKFDGSVQVPLDASFINDPKREGVSKESIFSSFYCSRVCIFVLSLWFFMRRECSMRKIKNIEFRLNQGGETEYLYVR